MRMRTLFVAVLMTGFCASALPADPKAADSLHVARSKDYGAPFDLVLSEIKREPRTSTLSVPGFHNRTAAGSRWLMCMYNELAIKRGFNYWTVIYPLEPVDVFPIAFYQSESEDVAKLFGEAFIAARAFPPRPTTVAMWNEKVCRRGR